jgi:hypothetical protein
MIKLNPLETLIYKYGIKNDEYRNWHRKFAFWPVQVNSQKYWLCNVFRRREEYQKPTPWVKYYWIHIPYNDLELIKQTDREINGDYKPLKWPPETKTYMEKVFLILVGLLFTGLLVFAVIATFERSERSELRTQLLEQVDRAQSLDELKSVVKELVEFSK